MSEPVPDLATVEAYHAAVIAAIERQRAVQSPTHHGYLGTYVPPSILTRDRALADRALEGLRRHQERGGIGGRADCMKCCGCYTDRTCSGHPWPCPDALDWWSVLTGIGTTHGETA